MTFEEFAKKEEQRRVDHVKKFFRAHGRLPVHHEMFVMFGCKEEEHKKWRQMALDQLVEERRQRALRAGGQACMLD